jgi:tRNA pseudouridine55 synthase
METEIILIDKPAGVTSFGVVARVRRVLSVAAGRKVKVGHTGTLDPFATGLMILLAGKGTKRAGEFSKLDKVYEATIRLGATSTTGDPEGEVTEIFPNRIFSDRSRPLGQVKSEKIDLGKISEVLSSFIGEIEQVPPIFSAIKINGERAYRLARKGKTVEMPARTVHIYNIEILGYEWPHLRVRAHVSSGTYIRSLARDVGEKLGVGGYLTSLRRVRVGEYDVAEARELDEFMDESGKRPLKT